jgi:putative membrane protein
MENLLSDYYSWSKAFHVISVISWMAGLFYLPRLYVYHVEGYQKRGVVAGSEMDLLFRHQERLLFRAIMTPAAVASWIFGLCLVFTPGIIPWDEVWPWVKAASVIAMTWFHFWLGKQRRMFLEGAVMPSGRHYRLMNEVPTVLLIAIVFSVILKF